MNTRELLHLHNEDEGVKGLCVRCWNVKQCFEVKILPEKFFSSENISVRLCDDCATKIESFVPRLQRLAISEYYKIFEAFVRNRPLMIRGYDDDQKRTQKSKKRTA